jgi:hypothetical protein
VIEIFSEFLYSKKASQAEREKHANACSSGQLDTIPLRQEEVKSHPSWGVELMAGQLRLSETQLSDLRLITQLSESQLHSVLARLSEPTRILMSQEEVRRIFSEAIPDHPRLVDALVRQVLALAGLQFRFGTPHAELLSALRTSLDGKLELQSIDAWNRIDGVFGELVRSQPIRNVVKSLELTYDYANLIHSTNVITDIRPIFDDEAEVVLGSVVSFTLSLSYRNGNNEHSLNLAFDAEEIQRLLDQCGRALKKAETARRHFSDAQGKKTRIEISGTIEK